MNYPSFVYVAPKCELANKSGGSVAEVSHHWVCKNVLPGRICKFYYSAWTIFNSENRGITSINKRKLNFRLRKITATGLHFFTKGHQSDATAKCKTSTPLSPLPAFRWLRFLRKHCKVKKQHVKPKFKPPNLVATTYYSCMDIRLKKFRFSEMAFSFAFIV